MDKLYRELKNKIRRKSTASLMGPKIKPANKCSRTAVYQAMALLVFVILGFFIYSNTLKSPFVFDDGLNIAGNRYIRLTKLALGDIITAGLESPSSHRPVANISFALNYYFHRYNVIGYHLTNIIIHILTGILLYLFVISTLDIPLLRRKYERYRWIAFFAALLWLVHPIQTQSVTYIVQRMTSLAAMFYILSLLLYVRGRLASQNQKRSWPWFTGCILAGILAFGCKETTVTLPFFILLYEWYFFQDLSSRWLRRCLPYVIGALIIFGLLGLWYLGSSPLEKILSDYDTREFTLTERLLTQPRAVIYYISLLAYPHPGRLNLDYDFAPSGSLIFPLTTLPCIGAIIGLIGVAFFIAKRERLLSFCILWFFGNLVIESSVIALELVFEHRLYLPSMLVSLAITTLTWRCIKQNWLRVAVFCILILLFCGWTYERNSLWRDPVSLWEDCVNKSPEKARPHNNLGIELKSQGKFDEAIDHYRQALKLKPKYAESHNNWGSALESQGKFDEAVSHFRQALRIEPDYACGHSTLGATLAKQGKLEEAAAHLTEALRLEPYVANTHRNLGSVLIWQGKLDEAVAHLTEALRLEPDFADAHSNLGVAFVKQGKYDEALAHFTEALRIEPGHADAHTNLGKLLNEAIIRLRKAVQLNPNSSLAHLNLARALESEGRIDEAITHYREALRLKPDWLSLMNNLAWLLATNKETELHNPEEAVQLAERASELTNYEEPSVLDTLAAAYAAADRFSEAVATAEKALGLAQSSGQNQLAEEIQNRLRLYKVGQPYRGPAPASRTPFQMD